MDTAARWQRAVYEYGRGAPPARRTSEGELEERRVDVDGLTYTLAEFIAEYGGSEDTPPEEWEASAESWVVTLQKTEALPKLGLDMDLDSVPGHLLVKTVLPGKLAAAFNETADPARAIRPGDRVVYVNGEPGSARELLNAVLDTGGIVELTMARARRRNRDPEPQRAAGSRDDTAAHWQRARGPDAEPQARVPVRTAARRQRSAERAERGLWSLPQREEQQLCSCGRPVGHGPPKGMQCQALNAALQASRAESQVEHSPRTVRKREQARREAWASLYDLHATILQLGEDAVGRVGAAAGAALGLDAPAPVKPPAVRSGYAQEPLVVHLPGDGPPVFATETFENGDRVEVDVPGKGTRLGTVRFGPGEVHFAAGQWVGVELDRPDGRSDGSMDGRLYFSCAPGHGVFAPPSAVSVVERAARVPSRTREIAPEPAEAEELEWAVECQAGAPLGIGVKAEGPASGIYTAVRVDTVAAAAGVNARAAMQGVELVRVGDRVVGVGDVRGPPEALLRALADRERPAGRVVFRRAPDDDFSDSSSLAPLNESVLGLQPKGSKGDNTSTSDFSLATTASSLHGQKSPRRTAPWKTPATLVSQRSAT